jgi:hypothetical protein
VDGRRQWLYDMRCAPVSFKSRSEAVFKWCPERRDASKNQVRQPGNRKVFFDSVVVWNIFNKDNRRLAETRTGIARTTVTIKTI